MVFVFQCGSSNEALLDERETLINYSGVVRVRRSLYDRVQFAADYAFHSPALASRAGLLFSFEWYSLTDRLEAIYGITELCQVSQLEDPGI